MTHSCSTKRQVKIVVRSEGGKPVPRFAHVTQTIIFMKTVCEIKPEQIQK